ERYRGVHRAHVTAFGASADVARRMGHRSPVSGLRKSGEEFPAEASISKLETPDGRLYTVVLRDITERCRPEESEHFLAEVGATLARSLDLVATLRATVDLPIPVLADWAVVEMTDSAGATRRKASRIDDPARDAVLRTLDASASTPTLALPDDGSHSAN